MSREWTAKWIGPEAGDESHPVIFKDFYIDDEIKKATLFITGLGIFEAYVNGQRVGGEYLTPYKSAGAEEVQYFSFDVTELLHCGPESEANSVDVFLGKGWNDNDPFALKAEFEIEVYKNSAKAEEASASIEEQAVSEDAAEELPAFEEPSFSEEKEVPSISDELDDLFNEDFLDEALAEAEEGVLDPETGEPETEKVLLLAMRGSEKVGSANEPFELDDLNELDDFLQGVIEPAAEAPLTEEEDAVVEEDDTAALEAEIQEAKARLEELKARLSKKEERTDEDDLEIFDFEDWDEENPPAPYRSAATEESYEENSISPESIEEIMEEEPISSPGADLEVAPYSITDAELEAMFEAEPKDEEQPDTEEASEDIFFDDEVEGADEDFDTIDEGGEAELEDMFTEDELDAELAAVLEDEIEAEIGEPVIEEDSEESFIIEDELPEDLGSILSDEELSELIDDNGFEAEAEEDQSGAVTLVGGLPFVVKDTDHDEEPDEADAFVEESLADAVEDIVKAEEQLAGEGSLVGGLPLAADQEVGKASDEVLNAFEAASKSPAIETEAALMGGLPFEIRPSAYVGNGLTDAVENITKNETDNFATEGELVGGLSITPEALEHKNDEPEEKAAEPAVSLVGGLPFVMKAEDEENPEEVQPVAAVEDDLSETLDSLTSQEDAPIATEGALVGGLPVALESETETIRISSDETWGYYASDIEFSSLDKGEIFNRLLWEGKDNPERNVAVLDLDLPLVERYSLPVVVKERLDVKEVIQSEDGSYILDFGQDFAGFVAFNSAQPKGASVQLTFAEELIDGTFPEETEDAGFTFISDGMPEVVSPHFTYFTGRYVKVSGWEGELNPADFSGCVLYSDIQRTGIVETSNEHLNTIYEELFAGQKRTSIVMPEESEAEDVFAYAPAAAYNMDIKEFLMQYLRGLKEQPASDQAAYAPQIIWNLYQMYGDEKILSENYDLIKAWADSVDEKDAERREKHYLCDFDTPSEAWVSMDQETETEYIASACYYEAARITSEAAAVLGREQDAFAYGRLARKIKQAFLEEYYTGAGRLSVDTQTAYVLALQFGLYVDRERAAKGLEKRLGKDGNLLKCAPCAAPFICKVLAENNMKEKAYDILLDQDQKSFNNEVEFIYEYMAGIKALEPGFKTIGLSPVPDGRIDFCKAVFKAPVGEIVSDWELKEDGSLKFHFEVPEGASAKITLPYYPVCAAGGNEVSVKSGSYDYSYMPSVTLRKDASEE